MTTPPQYPARWFPISLLTIAAAVTTGCATSASSDWLEPRTANAPFAGVLVVGVMPDERMRRDVEKLLVTDITTGKTRAWTSHAVEAQGGHAPHEHESLVAMIADTGADAVLIAHLVDTTITSGRTQSKAYVDTGPQVEVIEHPDFTEIYAGNYSVHQTATQLVLKNDTKVQAVLYDVADDKRAVYKVQVETKYDESGGDAPWVISDNVATAVTRALRGDRLIH